MFSLFLVVLALNAFASPLGARIIEVPGDAQLTIQSGINVASDGDSIVISPGTYHEHDLDFLGKAISVMSTDPGDSEIVASTVIDADSLGRVFFFYQAEDSESVLDGLTLTGGLTDWGGAVYCFASSPTITRNIISGNSTEFSGGGIYCQQAEPVISYNIITGNRAEKGGGGISAHWESAPLISNNVMTHNQSSFGGAIDCHYGSSPTIINNIMSDNKTDDGGGIYGYEGCSPLIRNNIIVNNIANYGGGIHCRYSCAPFVDQNTIVGNRAFSGGGLRIIFDCSPTIRNNIFWENDATVGDELYFGETCGPAILYTDVQGGRESVYMDPDLLPLIGPGLIDQEPGFISYGAIDFLLLPNSSCIDAGDPSVQDGIEWPEWYPDGLRSDMGAYGGPGGVNWPL